MTLNTPTPVVSGLFARYAAALLPAAVILLGALQVMLQDDRIDGTEGGQLIALVAGLGGTYLVPLVGPNHSGIAKLAFQVAAAVATLVIPLLVGFTWEAFVIFLLAAVSAVLTHLGIDARKLLDGVTSYQGVPARHAAL